MEAIRLKKYETWLADGRSRVTYGVADKSEVMVALVIGTEPLKIEKPEDYMNIDDVILGAAEHIRKQRRKEHKPKRRRGTTNARR